MTAVSEGTKTVMKQMEEEATELHALLSNVLQWVQENQEKISNASPVRTIPEDVLDCWKKAEAIKLWSRGNLAMERNVISRAEFTQIKLFAKSLRALVRGTSQSYNSMEFTFKQMYGGSRTVKRTFNTAATTASRLSHIVNTLEAE